MTRLSRGERELVVDVDLDNNDHRWVYNQASKQKRRKRRKKYRETDRRTMGEAIGGRLKRENVAGTATFLGRQDNFR